MTSPKTISVWAATSLGIGSVVGAGIFALMGEASSIAGNAVWLSFLFSGVVALLCAHSFVRLGILYPSRGGIVEYLFRGFGDGLFTGSLSVLFFIAQLIGASMIALSFGKFLSALLQLNDARFLWDHVFASALIVTLVALGLAGSRALSRIQQSIVVGNLVVLSVLAIAFGSEAQPARLSPSEWPELSAFMGSLALTFFAYTGFAVVSNSAGRMADPAKELPRAMYLTIAVVLSLYLILSVAVIAASTPDKLAEGGPTMLAELTKLHFGQAAFTVILITAITATIGSLYGGLYGITSVSYSLAEKGELPKRFADSLGAATRGLLISALAILIMVNFLSLTTIASLGGATSIVVYSLVNVAALRVVQASLAARAIIVVSCIACFITIVIWSAFTLLHAPHSFIVLLGFLAISVFAEFVVRHQGKRVRF